MSNINLVKKNPVIRFIKRDTVLSIALAAAAISMFFVPPSAEYVSYIDFKVLSCLFCLMAVVAGLRKTGLFDRAASALTRYTVSLRSTAFILVGATFFISMAITNDVALITFVPFSLLLLKNVENGKIRMRIITLQTIAANIGSSLTPVGNPQNLFLFSYYRMNVGDFFAAIFPAVLSGGLLLAASLLSVPDEKIPSVKAGPNYRTDPRYVISYAVLFVVSVLTVFRVFDYLPVTILVILFLLVFDRSIFARIDYSLLFTFTGFFIFIGNLQRIESINAFLTSIVARNVMLVGALASQFISNVPAAILLSGFTKDAEALLRGVSIGGMGTLITSLASVISFKFFSQERKNESLKYLGVFTVWNVLFFAVLFAVCFVIYR